MWKYILVVCALLLSTNKVYSQAINPVYEVGKASYYGYAHAGRKTKSGEIFNPHLLTAAHNRLPMGTLIEVYCIKTRLSVIVKVNDTGGFKKYGRILDLSEEAAKRIGITHQNGTETVEIRLVKRYVMRF